MEIAKNLITKGAGVENRPLNKNSDTKGVGSLFKNQPNHSMQTPSEEVAQKSLQDIDRLVNRLLNELKSSPSEAKLAEITNQAKSLQVSPNLAKDLKSLINLARQNPELKELAEKLNAFLKPIGDLKASVLNEQIKSSGIMLEANLKDLLANKNTVPSSINRLLSDIKNLSNPKLLNEILALAKDDTLSTNASFEKLSQILNSAKASSKEILNSSNIKSLLTQSAKLENMAKFLDKQANFMSEKGLSLSEQGVKTRLSKISEILIDIKEKIPNIASQKLTQSKIYSSNLKELASAISELEKSVENSLKQPNLINSFGEQILSRSNVSENLSLQDMLKTVAKKLNQALILADKIGFDAKNSLDEISNLSKQQNLAQKDIELIKPKIAEDTIKTLQNDVKSTLLNIQNKSEPNSQINQLSSKLLAQIEINQLVSSAAGGFQTYLPYVWEGVDGGNISFKRGKKQKHYAQIDLNFQKFGAINIMVALSENKYLDISVATQKEEFKELILSGAKELKKAISEQGLIVSNFSLKTMPKLSLKSVYSGFGELDMGFDKKI
ncbi:flagellar hook-length control protein FliK [Campylobacter sp.]|uniref:flagellar hook-length control protein FliK n=1 Tax=Campylobacter sp. TaxID=205 RepID=UPI0026F4E25E|nr:flagellar hook-length control protein FliK [Campylobacter sp.]